MALTHSEQKQITDRYALAGFQTAQEAGCEQAALEALEALRDAIASSDELSRAIVNPLLPKKDLAALFEALLETAGAPQSARQLVSTFIANGRASLLPLLASAFQARLDAAQGVTRGEVISAQELSPEMLTQITQALSTDGKKVVLSARTDASLIGGLKIYLGSKMIDASVVGTLSRLQHHLINTGATAQA